MPCWHVGPHGPGCDGWMDPPLYAPTAPILVPVVLPAGPLPAPEKTPEEYAALLQSHYSLCCKIAELEDKLKQSNLQVRELERAAEGGLRITCDNAYHDRGHGVCSFCVQKRIDVAVEKERERCAQLVNDWAKAYPASTFGEPEFGKHGPTVDSCSAKALRTILPTIAEEIRGHELDKTEKREGI